MTTAWAMGTNNEVAAMLAVCGAHAPVRLTRWRPSTGAGENSALSAMKVWVAAAATGVVRIV